MLGLCFFLLSTTIEKNCGVLNLQDTFEWGYVGEAGEEVIARNSHSLGLVRAGDIHYLALYGGASPEHGPLGDTLVAVLPAVEAVGMLPAHVI